MLRNNYFAHISPFSANSTPTTATVAEMINRKAAHLAGKLAAENASAASIGAASTSAAYFWCQDTVLLATAIQVMPLMTAQNPALLDSWRAELRTRYLDLETNGVTALGD